MHAPLQQTDSAAAATGTPQRKSRASRVVLALVVLGVIGAIGWVVVQKRFATVAEPTETASVSQRTDAGFTPTPAQWATLTVEPVTSQVFRREHVTEGKLAIDEDRTTPIFSPYSGRVIRLAVSPGDTVAKGQLLFTL